MSCSRPQRRASVPSRPDFLGHHAGEEGHFDRMPQHVLAVAGAEAQPAQQMDDRSMQSGDVGFLRRFFAQFLDVLLHLASAFRATTSSIRAGWMRPSAISLLSDMRATSRRTGSKPLTITTPGVSSMITSTPVAFSKARMLRPSRPMMRPFISSLGISTVLVVVSAVWAAAYRWSAVIRISRDFSSQISAICRSCLRISAPVLVLQFGVEQLRAAAAWPRRWLRPLSWCSVCRCMSSSLVSSSLRRLASSIRSASLRLVAFDHFLLFAELLGLLLERVLALVEQPLAFVELAADFAEFFLALFLLLEHHFLDLQFALAAAVVGVLIGLGDYRRRFAHGVLAAQAIEQFDENERHRGAACHGSDEGDNDDLSCRHDNMPSSYWTSGARRMPLVEAFLRGAKR